VGEFNAVTKRTFDRIIFATEPDGSFGTAGRSWSALDLPRIQGIVRDAGLATVSMRVDKLLEYDFKERDFVFYQSAVSSELRAYILETLYFVRERVAIAPRYELLLAHENKGIQELLKKSLEIGNLEGRYHVDFDERGTTRPYVFKTIAGAGSSGVHLVRGNEDESRIRRRYFSNSLLTRLKALHRRWLLSPGRFSRYTYYYKPFMRYVTQPFVEGLDGDLKILIFGDRYYTLSRKNRPGDFRASGSGRLDFDTPCSTAALDFARDIAAKLDSPFMSLDIAETKGAFHLLEFQALNFGPTTLTGSTGFYRERDRAWERVTAAPDLEESYAHAMLHYLERQPPER
jgi:glutathione synthase/RimK-type ligase-like ATP-grasp enzyme